jgi:DNA-binding transcriptional LysR family regulator
MDRLEELAVFVAILDAGSLAAAARRLRRSPPAVTRCLATLEDRLGVRLVERTTRRLAPTEAGRRFAEQARRLLAGYDETLRAAGADEPLRGLLRVTAPVVFGRRHVMPVIADFLRIYPQISVEAVFSDNNLDLIEAELDVAVRIGPLADSGLVARRVGEVESMLVASPSYIARRGAPQCLAALAEHDVIFTSGRPVPVEWRLTEDGRERSVRLTPRLMVNQVEASLSAAREGLGIARALSYQVVEDLEAGRLVQVLPGSGLPRRPVHLVVSGTRNMAARTRVFLDHAVQAFESLGVIHG